MTEAAHSIVGRMSRVAGVSIAVALAVMGIKYLAYLKTGSVALYSDALESIVNVVTAVAALVALRVSLRPADTNHPFGHHKAEYFSAVLEGALIVVAALMIFREAYDAFITPRTLTQPGLGLAINGFATAMNGVWSWFLIGRGRSWRSPALIADGRHLATDVLTSAGVLAGVSLAALTGWKFLDPLLAAAVATYILWAGTRIATDSMSGLMDQSVGTETETRIRDVIKANGTGAMQAHDVRTRHAGRATFIEFHLVVPGRMTVLESHEICDRIEAALEAEIDGAEVVIHVEPDHKAKAGAKGAIQI